MILRAGLDVLHFCFSPQTPTVQDCTVNKLSTSTPSDILAASSNS